MRYIVLPEIVGKVSRNVCVSVVRGSDFSRGPVTHRVTTEHLGRSLSILIRRGGIVDLCYG